MQPLFTSSLEALSALLFVAGMAGLFGLARGYWRLRGPNRTPTADDLNLLLKSPLVPALSLIAVVRDSSEAARELVRSLLQVHYGSLETIVVLNGIAEADLDVWKNEYRLAVSGRKPHGALPHGRVRCLYEPPQPSGLVVACVDSSGDVDCLNAAADVAESPLIGIVEPACELAPDAFLRLVRPLLEDPERTIAVCGAVPCLNQEGLLGRYAALESLRAWLRRCGIAEQANTPAWIPGLSVVIRREALLRAGGFRAGVRELLLRLRTGQPHRIVFLPEPVSQIQSGVTFRRHCNSLVADQRELVHALRSQGIRASGLVSLLNFLVLRPLLETAAYLLAAVGLGFGWITWDLALLAALATVGMGILQSMTAVVLGEMAAVGRPAPALALLFLAAIPENLGYRQWRNLCLLAGLCFR